MCQCTAHIVCFKTRVFNTAVDIKLKQWADRELPRKSVQVGWDTLQDEFTKLLERNKELRDHDDIFDNLKHAVKDHSMGKHKWDEKAEESLVSVRQKGPLGHQQTNTIFKGGRSILCV